MIHSNDSTVCVDLGQRAYPIHIGVGVAARLAADLNTGNKVFIVSDEIVWSLHGAQMSALLPHAHTLNIGQGEGEKTQTTLFTILNWLLDNKASRSDTLVAFGGGIVGDITGFAASVLKRGMDFVQVPTTVLAQVDSSVGGKTAINTPHGKNLIGAFYQPQAVYIDLDFLKTLPPRQISAGLAEVVKYGVISDPALFAYVETNADAITSLDASVMGHIIKRSCEIKADIVADDEKERGGRAMLNFGHTFGHALEVLNGYNPNLLHGEAVAIGMGLAARYAARLGLCDGRMTTRLDTVFDGVSLPKMATEIFNPMPTAAAVLDAMTQDKKATNSNLPLILANGFGQGFIHKHTDIDDLSQFLESEFNA